MGFFDPPKPKITKREFNKEVKSELHSAGFSHHKIGRVEDFFHGHLEDQGRDLDKGIDEKELEETLQYMQKKHDFSDSEREKIDSIMRKHL